MIDIPELSKNRLKYYKKLHRKKYRDQFNMYFGEGLRLFDAALRSDHARLKHVIISSDFFSGKHGAVVYEQCRENGIDLSICKATDMSMLSSESTPPGILFILDKPAEFKLTKPAAIDETVVYLEKVSDPGNLGTIIRSAAWFGLKTIILSPGSVDPWSPKTVKASAGGIFLVRIILNTDIRTLSALLPEHDFAATVLKDGLPLNKWKVSNKSVIFFGPEAHGLSEEILGKIKHRIHIPGTDQQESLNLSVAAGIVLYHYHLYRQSQD